MAKEDDFEPKLGKIRAQGSKRGRRYLQLVLHAVARAGGWPGSSGKGSRFTGARIGRGSAAGAVLRDRYSAFRSRRVVVKTRVMKLGPKGLAAARTHVRYLQREGVSREGLPGQLYDKDGDRADDKAFLERCEDDRHQFRFIVAAEDAAAYEDLKDFTRRLMRQMEDDLGTKLDWVAVDHHNTGHPHSHIVVRGKDDQDKDLIIARDYIQYGMRERACEIVSLDLGPRSDAEIEDRLRTEVGQERYTSLDRDLLYRADTERLLTVGEKTHDAQGRFMQTLRIGRLQQLKRFGLAEELAPGRWRLSPTLEETLREMGERGDIIKTLHKAMKRGPQRAALDYAIYDPTDARAKPLAGRLVERGLSDELHDRHYLVVDGLDGRAHYVEIGQGEKTDTLPVGSILTITPKVIAARKSDHTIAEIAAAHEGRYDIPIHMKHDPNCSWDFAEAHVRRLEALRRAGFAAREPSGTWTISADHLDKARAYEQAQARQQPVTIEVLSGTPLEKQIGAEAATWLDKELIAGRPTSLRESGFGQEVKAALARRRQWLITQGLAEERQGQVIYQRNLLATLRRRELARAAVQLSSELGLHYAEAPERGRIEGTYRRSVNLTSGRFAMIERSREFTLVPWRLVLERNLGKAVSGIARGGDISWSLGRKRGLGL